MCHTGREGPCEREQGNIGARAVAVPSGLVASVASRTHAATADSVFARLRKYSDAGHSRVCRDRRRPSPSGVLSHNARPYPLPWPRLQRVPCEMQKKCTSAEGRSANRVMVSWVSLSGRVVVLPTRGFRQRRCVKSAASRNSPRSRSATPGS